MTPTPDLSALATSLNDLRYLLGTSLGPLGADKVVETDAKAVLITNSGLDLLGVVSPRSPLLSLLLQSVKAHAAIHGDGSKRLLLLVERGLHEALGAAQGPSAASISCIIRGLTAVQDCYLGEVASRVADCMALEARMPSPPETVKQVLTAVFATHMVNKVGTTAVKHLASLLAELVCKKLEHSVQSSMSAWDVLSQLHAQPPLRLMPGSMVTTSRLLPGFLLTQGLASPHMYLLLDGSSPVRFVVLDCAVDAADGTGVHPGPSNVAIEAASQEGLRAAAHAQQRLMRSRLEVLAGLRVHLLVTTQPVSALLTFLCVEAGLALVAGVEEEEARGLCHAAGICISSLAGHAALQSASVGEAAGCYRLELSRTSTGLLIELPTQGRSTLMLCAPSEGLCRQYAKLVKSALAVAAAAVSCSGTAPTSAAPVQAAAAMSAQCVSEKLNLLPGGMSFEAALAVQIAADIAAIKMSRNDAQHAAQGGSSPVAALQLQHPASVLLPALQVLHAMAMALPMALAKTGVQSRASAVGTQEGAAAATSCRVQRKSLQQVHDLLSRRGEEQFSACGLLHEGTAPGLGPGARQALGLQPEASGVGHGSARPLLTASRPGHHGVLEARGTVLATWHSAMTLLIQVLRIDGVVSASSQKADAHFQLGVPSAGYARTARKGSLHGSSLSGSSAASDDEGGDVL